MTDIDNIIQTIHTLESQRAVLGDSVVETALASLKDQLAALQSQKKGIHSQLKLVTVLFLDVVGSTRMGKDLDPEETLEIMDTALMRFGHLVEAYGGRVLRYMGDGLKAVFGMPIARENDAEQAVRAGLALLADARAYSQEIEARWGLDGFNIRIGVHSGKAILGGGVEADNSAMGMTINLAARMESSAPPGSLQISHDTYLLVRGIFEVESLEPIHVKGRDEPIRTYLVSRTRPHDFHQATRGLPGIETRLVGRDVEIERLKTAFHEAVEGSSPRLVTVIGEPGVGKSRLLEEFGRWVEGRSSEKTAILKARAIQQKEHLPYSTLRDLLACWSEIIESDPAPVACQKLESALSGYLGEEPQMKAHLIGALAGFDFTDSNYLAGVKHDPQQLADRALYYLAQFFDRLSGEIPTIIFLDDIHWADEPSLDAIERIFADCLNNRLLIVGLTRYELFERRPDWGGLRGGSEGRSDRIELQPLSQQACSRLLDDLLKDVDSVPETLRQTVLTNANGNPFFLEEMVLVLIDGVAIRADNDTGGWQLDTERLSVFRVPQTLTAVLQSRLDNLTYEEKQTLHGASIAGRAFWDVLLQKMADPPRSRKHELAALSRRRMIVENEISAFPPAEEYAFKNAILQDVVYDTVLKRDRKVFHLQVAEWLVEIIQKSGRGNEYQGIIAGHYERAGVPLIAADWYMRAAESAKNQGAFKEAARLFEQARRLIPLEDRERRWQLLSGWSEVLGVLGDSKTRPEVLNELVLLGEELGEGQKAEAYFRYGYYLDGTGDYRQALQAYQTALDSAAIAGDRSLQAWLSALMAIAFGRLGEIEQARAKGVEAQRYVEDADEITATQVLTNLGVFYVESGDLARAALIQEEQARLCHRAGNLRREAYALDNLGYVYVMLGLFDQGRQALESSLQICRSIGDRRHGAYSMLNLGLAYLRGGEQQKACDILEEAGSVLQDVGDAFGSAAQSSYLGNALEEMGQTVPAMERYESAKEILAGIGVSGYAIDALAGQARCSLAFGKLDEAHEYAVEVSHYLKEKGVYATEFPIRDYLTCANIFMQTGELAKQTALIEEGFHVLMTQADKISESNWRESFLTNVPEHREIIERYRQRDKV